MVRPERFELPAFWFVARRSIQLSYGRISFPTAFQQLTADSASSSTATFGATGCGIVLEMKFDNRFPVWMRELVRNCNLYRTCMAKYVQCAYWTPREDPLLCHL